jgi:beta-hydroxylase
MNIFQYKISNYLLVILLILFIFINYTVLQVVNFYFSNNKNNELSNEEILKNMKLEIVIQYLSWFSYLVFFIILMNINITQTKNLLYKNIFTLLFIFIIFAPIFPILNIINIILFIFVKNPPFIKNIDDEFPLNKILEENTTNIKREFEEYSKNNIIDSFRKNNPLLGNIDTMDLENDYSWRTLYIKKTGKNIDSLETKFPKTMELLKDERIHNAFFSILDPYVQIKPHIGYYKGYLRYHLGILVPDENGKKPYIICGNEKYEWKESKGVLFDDMYVHYVNNPTSQKRVVLYLDVKRKETNWVLNSIINFGNYIAENSFVVKLFIKNQHKESKL